MLLTGGLYRIISNSLNGIDCSSLQPYKVYFYFI